MIPDVYIWLKALHIGAAITFVGGVLVSSLLLSAFSAEEVMSPSKVRMAQVVRSWDSKVTTPAMLVVWALGLTLALQAGWFASIWLSVKLVFVLILSALHGMQSGALRRLAGGAEVRRQQSPLTGPIIVISAVAIAILVVVKPFG